RDELGVLARGLDAPTGSERDQAARADVLAKAALDALVDPRRDRWRALDVPAHDGVVFVDEDAGVEQLAGVDELLDSLHHRVRLVAPLTSHERGHGAAGAVLGLQ